MQLEEESGSWGSSTEQKPDVSDRETEVGPGHHAGRPGLIRVKLIHRWGHSTEKLDSPSGQLQGTVSHRSTWLRKRSSEFLAQFCHHVVTCPLSCTSFAFKHTELSPDAQTEQQH